MVQKISGVIGTYCLFLTMLLFSPCCMAEEDGKALTLEQAIALTLRHNTQVKSAYLQRQVDAFALRVAGREFVPVGTFSVSGNDAFAPAGNSSSASAQTSASLKTVTGGNFNALWSQTFSRPGNGVGSQSSASVSFTQPLLKGAGLSFNEINQTLAQRAEQRNIQALRSMLINTVTNVIFSYRRFVLAQQQLAITGQSIERSRKNLERQKALVKMGRVAANKVIQLENDLASRALSYRQQQNSVEDQRVRLLSLMNVDRQMRIQPVLELDVEREPLKLEALQQLARQYQPAYIQGTINLANQATRLQQAEDQQLWDASITAAYSVTATGSQWQQTQQQLGQRRQGNYSVGVTLSVPLGDLTREQAYISARIARETAELAWQDTEKQLDVDVQTSMRNVNLTWETIALAKRVTELSRKQLQGETVKVDMGISSNYDLILAQDALVQAENGEVSAKMNYLNALTSLHQLLGTTLRQWHINIAEHDGVADD
jgi:outer membrane protein TolC